MTRAEVMMLLKSHQAEFHRLGVEHLYLFGSSVRDEAGDTSDVDLFFDHERGRLGLFDVMDIRDRATAILGRRADIVTRASLHPRLKPEIEHSAERIF